MKSSKLRCHDTKEKFSTLAFDFVTIGSNDLQFGRERKYIIKSMEAKFLQDNYLLYYVSFTSFL